MNKHYYALSFITLICSNSCICPMKNVTLAPVVSYDIVKPTSVSAAGTVKIEFADYCPSKEDKQAINKRKARSLALLDRYLAGTISRDKYNEDQEIIQNQIENIVSLGRGLAQQRPIAVKIAKSIASAPVNIVTSTVGVVADTATSGTQAKPEKVIVPAAESGATQVKMDAALKEPSAAVN